MSETDQKVRMLGGVEVTGPFGTTRFSGAKQRAVFARLAADPGHNVSAEQLIDDVWGDSAPASVRASLQVHVSQLRRALASIGLHGTLISRPAGYMLQLEPAEVDVGSLELALVRARGLMGEGHLIEAFQTARSALGLWRGAPFSDTGSAPFSKPRRASLDAARVELLCVAADAGLGIGRPSEVLSLVESAAHDHPYDEQLWRATARLLYGLDRQADAIERLATLRRTLLDDLGLDPAGTTIELEASILNHDPMLHQLRQARPQRRRIS